MDNSYAIPGSAPVVQASVESRATFILRTYAHLFGAIVAFTGIEIALFTTGLAHTMAVSMLSVNWLFVLGAFLIVGWLASRVAMNAESRPMQYLALTAFVVAEAIIFVPMLFIVQINVPGGIESAALITFAGFLGLTWVAFATRKDFSWLGGIVRWGMICALLLIVGGALFGFQLGTFFSVAMVGIAGAAILYDTSNILHHYPQDRYVGASLALFASVALMFWYVLQLVLSFADD